MTCRLRPSGRLMAYAKRAVRCKPRKTTAVFVLLWLPLAMALFTVPLSAQEARFDSKSRTKALLAGWGHSWQAGFPGFGETETDIAFGAFHPQLGWFMTDRFELYGEGTLMVYNRPTSAVAGGIVGLAGRYHLWNDRPWTPYLTLGGGFIWTSLDVKEIDRTFNFQVIAGGGVRFVPRKNPGWIIEFRNHHISNAGTAGENIGINAATILVGVQWVVR